MLSDLFLFLNEVVFIKETIHIFIYFSHALLGLVTQSCLTTLQSFGLQPARLLCPWDFSGKTLEWVAIFSSIQEFIVGLQQISVKIQPFLNHK